MEFFKTNENGLTTKQAEELLDELGENRLEGKKKIGRLKIFLGQFKDLMVIILLISTALSIMFGEVMEAMIIIIIVLLNALLGYFQEYRTEKTMEALATISAPTAEVLRDGRQTTVPAAEVVPGDVLVLKAGDRIAADGVALQCSSLYCDEAFITGESEPVEKTPYKEVAAGGRNGESCTVYMGSTVTKGSGRVQVTQTGMNTEMGKIATMLDEIEEEQTPLQKRLEELGKYIAVACLVICTVVAVTGILRGEDVFEMIVTGISLAVAAVPEGLPAIVTIALALAVNRILKRNALVRKLHAIETLGAATVICSDKTGTLTENKMTVKELYTPAGTYQLGGGGQELGGTLSINGNKLASPPSDVAKLMEISVCCNNAQIYKQKNEVTTAGEPTEIALLYAGEKLGLGAQKALADKVKIKENPFDSERKMMSVAYTQNGANKLLAKGAPDVLLDKCTHVLTGGKVLPLDSRKKQEILAANNQMAERALRVIAAAYKDMRTSGDLGEDNLVFVGMCGMIDPPRKEAYKAVKTCGSAGIKTIMITGDHVLTASAIAKDLGILKAGNEVITGKELDTMDERDLLSRIGNTTVFARVTPAHKLRIVKALKSLGEVVAMTGDGVNDAPAIKEANIGVAMGISGTDVTKEASSIILLDDNFATLVAAVEEGRVIYANIRRFIRYLLSCNIGEVLTMFVGMLMGLPVVLLPIQILLVNLVTDGLPAIALGLEKAEKDVMLKKPRSPESSIFSEGLLGTIVVRGCFIGISTLVSFVIFYRQYYHLETARTAALMTLIMAQLFHVFECRAENKPIWQINPFSNPQLLLATAFSAGVALCAVYVPVLQVAFKTVPLLLEDWFTILVICIIPPVLSGIKIALGQNGRKQNEKFGTFKQAPAKYGFTNGRK